MRSAVKRTIGIVAIAGAAFFATATAASATVAVNDAGVGTVDKGDVQSALGWNNKAFDAGVGTLKFTLASAPAEKVMADYVMSCYDVVNGTGVIPGAVSHNIISTPGTATASVASTPIYNDGNGKQITGFNLTGKTLVGFKASGPAAMRTVSCPEGSVSFMNIGQGDLFGKTVFTGPVGGLMVNGVALPNTL